MAEHAERWAAFDRVRMDAPSIEVGTSDGTGLGLEEIVAFAAASADVPAAHKGIGCERD